MTKSQQIARREARRAKHIYREQAEYNLLHVVPYVRPKFRRPA